MIRFNTSLITMTILVVAIWVLPAISYNVEDAREICRDILIKFCKFQNTMKDSEKNFQAIRHKRKKNFQRELGKINEEDYKREKRELDYKLKQLSRNDPQYKEISNRITKLNKDISRRKKAAKSRQSSETKDLIEYLKDILERSSSNPELVVKYDKGKTPHYHKGKTPHYQLEDQKGSSSNPGSSSYPDAEDILEKVEIMTNDDAGNILENLANQYKGYLSDQQRIAIQQNDGLLGSMIVGTTKVDDPINEFCLRIMNEGNYQNFFSNLLNK